MSSAAIPDMQVAHPMNLQVLQGASRIANLLVPYSSLAKVPGTSNVCTYTYIQFG